jgi:acyl carrier protein
MKILKKLKKVIQQVALPTSKLTLQTHLKQDLGMDSLTTALLITELEWQFNVQIEDEQWEQFVTIKQLGSYLESATK